MWLMIEVPKITWELHIYSHLMYNEYERNYGNDWN